MSDDAVETRVLPARRQSDSAHLNRQDFDETVETIAIIKEFVSNHLVSGEDYESERNVKPGEKARKVLKKSGAEKIAMLFDVMPDYLVQTVEIEHAVPGHVEYVIEALLTKRTGGHVVSRGLGSCTTMESKYRYRYSKRRCPSCKAEAIIASTDRNDKTKQTGWHCWRKARSGAGCGRDYKIDDRAITQQPLGEVENERIYDLRNNVLKIAKKRSYVDAVIVIASVADSFTQDIENDEEEGITEEVTPPPSPQAEVPPARESAPSPPPDSPDVEPVPDDAVVAEVAGMPEPKSALFKMLAVEFSDDYGKMSEFLLPIAIKVLSKPVDKISSMSKDEARKIIIAIRTKAHPLPSEK